MKQNTGVMGFLQSHPARAIFFVLSGLAILWAVVNYPVMITLWRHGFDDGTYSHAYLIPFIFLYLLYVLAVRGELIPRQELYWPVIVAFILVFLGYSFSIAAQLSLLYWVFSLALLANAYWLIVRFSMGLAYALAFLLFMYPMWGALQFVLQHMSVFAVMKIMGLTGIPTYVENTSVMIPEGTFVIAGGCSGLRYFIVSLAIGSLFVFLNLRNKRSIAKFMALAIVGALITNWIRIVALILIGHFTDMQSDLMRDHNNFGWYIYAPFIVLLFWFGEKLVKKERGDFQSEQEEAASTSLFPLSRPTLIVACIGILLSSSALQLSLHARTPQVAASCAPLDALGEAKPHLPYPATTCVKQQTAGGVAFDTLSVLFTGADLDGKPTQYQVAMTPEGWKELDRRINGKWTIKLMGEGRRRHFIAYSYIAPGGQVATEGEMKKLRIKNALTAERRSGLLWAHAVCDANCDSIAAQWPAVAEAFQLTRF